ncbi:MAG: AsmA-like C-terminal domain-containing protein [Nitrospira sp.]|nr:AsmA-like C-terminal domain-containing protein [Nitrospira sp.]
MAIPIFILTVLSDTRWVKQSLIDGLEGTIGGPIQIDTLNVNLWPTPEVHVAGLSFETKDPHAFAFRANQVEVAIGWASLWNRTLMVSHILISQPEVTLTLPMASRAQQPRTWQIPHLANLEIRNGQLHLLRQFQDTPSQALDWDAIHFSVTTGQAEGSSVFGLTVHTPDHQGHSSLTLTGTLTPREIDETLHSQEERSALPTMNIQGQIELSKLPLSQLNRFLGGQTPETLVRTQADFRGNFSYTILQDQDLLEFQHFQLSLDEWSVTGQGSMANILLESPWLQVSGSAQPLAIGRLPTLLPHAWIPSQFWTFLNDHQVAGTVELHSGSLDGPLNGNGEWHTQGILDVQGGQFLPTQGQPLITNVSASLAFTPASLEFSHVHGDIAPFTFTAPDASLTLKDKTVMLAVPTFQVAEHDWHLNGTATFTATPDTSPILTVSGSALPISMSDLAEKMPAAWLPISLQTTLRERNIDGEMELLTGSVKWVGDTTNTLVTEAVIRMAHGQILIAPQHPLLTQLSGDVVVESHLVRALNLEAAMGESTVRVKEATIEQRGADLWIDVQGHGRFAAQEVHQALLRDSRTQPLHHLLTQYHDIHGTIDLSTHLQMSLSHPPQISLFAGQIVLDDLYLLPSSEWLPIRQLNGQLSFEGSQIHIHRLQGIFGEESPVTVKGQWSFRENSKGSNLGVDGIWSSRDLQVMLPFTSQVFSTFDGSITSRFNLSGASVRPHYDGKLDFTNLALETKGLFHKPSGVPAIIRVKGTISGKQTVRLTKGDLSMPPYQLEAQGQLFWSDPPSFRGILQTESGTGAMFPPGVFIGDDRLGLTSLDVQWGVEGKNWDWSTWYMKGNVEATTHSPQATSSNTSDEGRSLLLQWWQKHQKGQAKIVLKDFPIERLIASPSDTSPPLTGLTSLHTSLHMKLGSHELLQRSLTGKGSCELQNGHIQTGPVLSKILRLLNIPSLLMGKINLLEEGLPFDHMAGSFEIENGLLGSKDLAIKSPVLKLTAAGSYDIPSEHLDGIVAVSPFGAYSNLLKDIPLFGTLIKGERKGLMTAIFEVKGPQKEPKITYLPLESFTGGLTGVAQFAIDVLRNVVTLPIPNKNQESDKSFTTP